LSAGLARLGAFDFPVMMDDTTRGYFQKSAALETPDNAAAFRAIAKNPQDQQAVAQIAKSPYLNALLRTTCVATRLEGGHANNALPQTAAANVNCRMFPADSLQNVQSTLKRVVADDQISIAVVGDATAAPGSPLDPQVVHKLEEVSTKLYPGLPFIPGMDTGATP